MTDKMIAAGAKRLSELAPALKDPDEALLPPFGGESKGRRGVLNADAAKVNFEVALAVLDQAVADGVARANVPESKEERRQWAQQKRWKPEYPEIRYDPKGIA
jgi:malate dehydrogenase (oxaloacetate-decarboxylating)